MSSATPTPSREAPASDNQPARRRPIGVTVFAILSILLGVIGLLSAVGSLVMFLFFRDSIAAGANPIDELLDNSFGYRIFYLTILGLKILFSALLLFAGIGLLSMSKQARKLAIAYAVYAIPATIIVSVVDFLFLYAPMLAQMGQQLEQQIVPVVMLCVAVVSAFLKLVFPVAILFYFLRPSIKQTFLNWEQATAD